MNKIMERCHGLKRRGMYVLSNAKGELEDTSFQMLSSVLFERVHISYCQKEGPGCQQ